MSCRPGPRALPSFPPVGTPERKGPLDAVSSSSSTAIDLALWIDSPAPKKGDLLELQVSSSLACHLTLIGIDGEGRALVLFPNELEPLNLIAPGVAVRVPGPAAGYQFRLDRAGSESYIAICQRGARVPEGMAFDYEKQRFTVLGDWRKYLDRLTEKPAKSRYPVRGPTIGDGGPVVLGRATRTISIGE